MPEEPSLKEEEPTLSPEEEKALYQKFQRLRATAFFAALLMMLLGFSNAYESLATLLSSGETLTELFGYNKERVTSSAFVTLGFGIFEVLCAFGTIRLNYFGWRSGFFVTIGLMLNSFVSSMVLYDSWFSIRSIVAAVLTPIIVLLLYKARALFPKPETT
ncbi:MAG: hypothetical protein RMI34_02500 [Chloroherpetonaceae bacterium]|nr:hypothetical protein [Chloroherpetonaceae bacterium]MDW8018927.1 hypothetical protein [Chloroherpetonaceae bacterium]MDW8465038.1 hypothetical protein [Chloroherpetonaceae bacterium]